MIGLFSIEFWIATLFILYFLLVIFFFLFVRKVNRLDLAKSDPKNNSDEQESEKQASRSAGDIIEILEPLVKESRNVAITFDEQIKEKKSLLKKLNDALDSRVISINLLLSRADALQNKLEERQNTMKQSLLSAQERSVPKQASNAVLDQQNQIIKMYNQNINIDSIAERLSIPKGEVQLVIDLKKKFIAMEKTSK